MTHDSEHLPTVLVVEDDDVLAAEIAEAFTDHGIHPVPIGTWPAMSDYLAANPRRLGAQLGMLGVPAFCFHEGGDAQARFAFQQVAKLTRGAYCPFDSGSARQLRDLLSAVAVYAAGGLAALSDFGGQRGGVAGLLTDQLKKP